MDHVEIDVIELQWLVSNAFWIVSLVASWSCQILVVTKRSLRARPEEAIAAPTALSFILIHSGRIEMSIAERQRTLDHRLAIITLHSECPEAEA
jgi:hypothetical protein